MTPEQQRQMEELLRLIPDIKATLEWRKEREKQQIKDPLDDASRNTLGGVSTEGPGPTSDLTDTINIGAGGGSANVPKAYSGTLLIRTSDGSLAEIPRLS